MTWGLVAVAGATVVGGVMASNSSKSAANTAANATTNANNASIAESQRQFDSIQQLLSPYTSAGTSALTAQQNLLGLNGNGAQQSAVDSVKNGSEYQTLLQQGTNSILQNASATGGLRGGNTEAALQQYSPTLLNSLIQQKYSNLGGLVSVGQNAAAGVGNAGTNSSNQITSALQSTGSANANAALASGQANSSMWNNLSNTASMMGMLKLMGKF